MHKRLYNGREERQRIRWLFRKQQRQHDLAYRSNCKNAIFYRNCSDINEPSAYMPYRQRQINRTSL